MSWTPEMSKTNLFLALYNNGPSIKSNPCKIEVDQISININDVIIPNLDAVSNGDDNFVIEPKARLNDMSPEAITTLCEDILGRKNITNIEVEQYSKIYVVPKNVTTRFDVSNSNSMYELYLDPD